MNRSIRSWTWLAGLIGIALGLGCAVPLFGQASDGPYRSLAPGVMKSVDPQLHEAETVSRHPVVELVAADPDITQAKQVRFERKIWYLEFKFKPMRMILVDVPQSNGRMKQKLIWYMVYSVTNPGKAMPSVKAADGTYELQPSDEPIRFIPKFEIATREFPNEKPFPKVYPDRVIPVALGPIRTREDPAREFHNSVDMVRQIKPGETVWGVATWEDVDPRIDRFSVYVTGLTNAYLWKDTPEAYQPGASLLEYRKFSRKTLKLNFWRPGDPYYENEKEFRLGAPGEVDYEWVYR